MHIYNERWYDSQLHSFAKHKTQPITDFGLVFGGKLHCRGNGFIPPA
jgi:hypothetical protein